MLETPKEDGDTMQTSATGGATPTPELEGQNQGRYWQSTIQRGRGGGEEGLLTEAGNGGNAAPRK